MTDKIFAGEIKAKIVEVRFGLSGKTEKVLKKAGDFVRKGELLAVLDKKMLQAELDRQLADYEKVRADFEIFNLQNGKRFYVRVELVDKQGLLLGMKGKAIFQSE